MKYIAKKQDGYVLAYVLVVVMVVSIIAVFACTTAVKNHDAQIAAIDYTKAKYDVEGAMERFVAELQVEMVKSAEAVYNEYPNVSSSELVTALQGEIDAALFGDENEAGKVGIIPGIKVDEAEPEYDIEVRGENLLEYEDYGFITYDYAAGEGSDEHSTHLGYFPMEITIRIIKNGIEVKAVVDVIFNAKAEKNNDTWNYTVTGASFEYASYSVTTVQAPPEGGAA